MSQEQAMTRTTQHKAVLVLQDGTVFEGLSCATAGEVYGELCFNNAMIGYPAAITDTAYAGKILVLTYPQVGNYGLAYSDLEHPHVHLAGLVLNSLCPVPSNFRSDIALGDYLIAEDCVCAEGIDTRALVKHLRTHGSVMAVLSSEDLDVDSLADKLAMFCKSQEKATNEALLKNVSSAQAYEYQIDLAQMDKFKREATIRRLEYEYDSLHVAVIDCGVTASVLQNLAELGCKITVLPFDAQAHDVLALNPDAVVVAGGPDCLDAASDVIKTCGNLMSLVPLLGIGLGHLIIASAAGALTTTLKSGHYGANYPVYDLTLGSTTITSQAHKRSVSFVSLGKVEPDFAKEFLSSSKTGVEIESLINWLKENVLPVAVNDKFGRIMLSEINLNDASVEGLRFLDLPVMTVQYKPERSSEFNNKQDLYSEFLKLAKGFWAVNDKTAYLALNEGGMDA